MGDAACSFDPFVEVAQVDDFKAAFGHFIKEPLPQLSGGGGQSVLNAELAMFSRPSVFSLFPSVWGIDKQNPARPHRLERPDTGGFDDFLTP